MVLAPSQKAGVDAVWDAGEPAQQGVKLLGYVFVGFRVLGVFRTRRAGVDSVRGLISVGRLVRTGVISAGLIVVVVLVAAVLLGGTDQPREVDAKSTGQPLELGDFGAGGSPSEEYRLCPTPRVQRRPLGRRW